MCGIVGYIGSEEAAPILLDGLSRLEYRGYDSAGMAVYDGNDINVTKAVGRLKVLKEITHNGSMLPGKVGIGHTRWATNGVPSDVNSHPHCNGDETIAVVHNGIIENYIKIKHRLEEKGYSFKSETDTEVVAHMLDYFYEGNPLEAIIKVMHRVEGSYAFGIIFKEEPDKLFAVRKNSPLIVGKCDEGSIIASDVPAVLKYTRNVCYIDNDEIAVLTKDDISFYNSEGDPIKKSFTSVDWDVDAAEKGGYEHFMLKEIYEQPRVLENTVAGYIENSVIGINGLSLTDEEMKALRRVNIVACGSAYHTGVAAKYVIERLARVPVEVDLASEFRYREPILYKDEMLIVVSQSGETADTLEALREVKKQGVHTLAIVNVVGSSIAREADDVIYTVAGPEIAVATTKAYSAQLIAEYAFAMKLAKVRGTITAEEEAGLIKDLLMLPKQVKQILENKEQIQHFAARYVGAEDVFFIGRGIDYATALEGSLKLKEISYIHSESYAAGELKHGSMSLIQDGTLVVAVDTQEELYKKTQTNIVEVKTRGAFVLAITNEGNTDVEKIADYVIYVPKTNKYFTNSLAVIPLQLFGYYISIGRGLDVDKPRNLAKSVTVE